MDLKLYRIKEMGKNSNLLALVDVLYNRDLVICGVRIINGRDGRFVTMPQRSYEKDGKTNWINITYFVAPSDMDTFKTEVLKLYNEHCASQSGLDVPQDAQNTPDFGL